MKRGYAFPGWRTLPPARAHPRRNPASLGLVIFSLAATAWAAETQLEFYPENSSRAVERRVEATVQGRPLALTRRRVWHADSKGEHFMEVASARFASDGPVAVRLQSASKQWGTPVLRTCGRDLPVQFNEAGLAFDLPGPGQYYLGLPALALSNATFTVVFWVDDLGRLREIRAQSKASGARDVTKQGLRADTELDQTAALQRLLDGGGALRFPAGVYRAGSLRFRSGTTVYFEPGAVLRAVDADEAVGPEFLAIEGAQDVRLCGPGILDANSLSRRRGHNVHHLNITGSRDVALEDVLLEESNSWAVHIRKSERFAARNVKIFSGKDGFDPDSSRDVLIDGAFVVAADDAIAVKNRFPEEADRRRRSGSSSPTRLSPPRSPR